jgi:predicted CXXCH cytochrome family protein
MAIGGIIMHRYLAMVLLLAFLGATSTVLAEALKNRGPEVINFKMGVLQLPFQHWKHQKLAKGDCLHCHDRNGEKIKDWGKETAHTICIPCHDLDSKGPVLCHECHNKTILSPKK